MINKLRGLKQAFFAETLLVVLPPSIIGLLAAGSVSLFSLILLIAIVAFWDLGINVINHYSDWKLDKINNKRTYLHKYFSRNELLFLYLVFLISSFLITYILLKPSMYFYIVLLIEVLFGISYSMYIKIKEKFVVNYLWIALMYGFFSFLMGFFAVENTSGDLVNYLPIIIFITILYFSISMVKDYSDMKGDSEEGRKTIPLVLGKDKALKLQYGLITLGYFVLIIFIALGYLNIIMLLTFFFYITIIIILSRISKTKDTKHMRKISTYTKVNTLALDITIIVILLFVIHII
jgi:4-hydroxybenzoate polyprenyltransferase